MNERDYQAGYDDGHNDAHAAPVRTLAPVPPCETETPDLDSIALDLRLVASVLTTGNPQGLDLPQILADLADAVDVWHRTVEG